MKDLIPKTKSIVISSKEIAEITGRRHDNILRDIKADLSKLHEAEIDTSTQFEETSYINTQNKTVRVYLMSKDGALQLAARYDPVVRHKIIARLNKLEKEVKHNLPQSFSEALMLAAQQAKQLEEQQPKVEYHDNVLRSDTLLTTTQIAKDYGLTANKLNKILVENKVQYKQSGQWMLYAKYLDNGYTHSSTATYDSASKIGVVHTSHTTKWTELGKRFIHEKLKDLGYVKKDE